MKARDEVKNIDKPIEPLKHYFVITDKPITLSSEDRMYGKTNYTRDDSFMEECPGLATHDYMQGYFNLHDPEHCYLQGSD